MKSHFDINDQLFEAQFKTAVLDPAVFGHEAHLRLAWIHIKNYGVENAIENICRQLKVYVAALGASDKYNETLTVAAIRAVNHFMLQSDSARFHDFIDAFPRLKYSFKELMACHYKMDIFNNAIAKREYIAPDLLPF